MKTFNQIDRKDIGSIWAAIDWDDNRRLYLSVKDLSGILELSEEYLKEKCSSGSFSDSYGITFIKTELLINNFLKEETSEINSRMCNWLEYDILPSIRVMNYGMFIKL